ncbi:Photosystem II 12 kDa extrinsic protein (PsbU) [Synechococcus sp. PCC 7502]|uniref:photosystem II complex extrinsic protein PsbU n=1 Tax=Synechococcus sp. PCC 7502 TaxID=1173263 RepID=UPI00029FA975|nr:photosystem II complex extrinsic protein PsbU [Synechococcus sp. PCC 7502]AFY73718.1 Photosystem II 12 kDa extrinsic protein (PsbU) [Synechococcus sp. PCC 7502]
MKAVVSFSIVALLAILTLCTFGISGNAVNANELPKTNFIKVDSSKIDLNNSNINAFKKISGFYPTLGRILIQNAPYKSLDDVLNIPGLTEAQQQKIKDNADKFTLYQPDNSLNRERYNNSLYRL